MEFNEKLRQLRKQKGLTQEELAQCLFVTRTAVSKWESGRGYPEINSLKTIASFFSVTIDELLSSGEMLTIAQEEQRLKHIKFRERIFGLLDISIILLLILPFFGQESDTGIHAVSLMSLHAVASYMKVLFFVAVFSTVLFGLATLALQNFRCAFKVKISLVLNTITVLLFILSQQPYCAVFCFVLLVIKLLVALKNG